METKMLVIAAIAFMAIGYCFARLERWMDEELPTNREIRRRMKRPPNLRPLTPKGGSKTAGMKLKYVRPDLMPPSDTDGPPTMGMSY